MAHTQIIKENNGFEQEEYETTIPDDGDIRCQCGNYISQDDAVICDGCGDKFCEDCIVTKDSAGYRLCLRCLDTCFGGYGSNIGSKSF